MTGQRESGDRRAGSLVVLAVLLGAGAAWFFLLQRKSGLGETPPLRLAAPVVSGAVEPEPEEPEESEEPDDSRLYAESGMTLDEFIKVLEKEAPKPVAAAVVEAFQREPELRDTYGTFVKERGKSASAAEFVRAVRPLAEFRKLLARFKGDSGFSGALAKIQRNPGAAKVLRASLSGPPSPATAPAARTAIDGRGQRIGQGATARTGVSYAAQPQAAGERAGLGEQGSHAYQAGQAGKPGAAGQGAHNVTPLDKQWKDTSVVDKSADGKKIEALLKTYPCLQTLGEATVRQFINSGDVDALGLWGACFKLHLYSRCVASGCSAPLTAWKSCMDWKDNSELACIKECRSQGPCNPDGGYLAANDRLCLEPGRRTQPAQPPTECGTGGATSPAAAATTAPEDGNTFCVKLVSDMSARLASTARPCPAGKQCCFCCYGSTSQNLAGRGTTCGGCAPTLGALSAPLHP